jgi:hypothetical protein
MKNLQFFRIFQFCVDKEDQIERRESFWRFDAEDHYRQFLKHSVILQGCESSVDLIIVISSFVITSLVKTQLFSKWRTWLASELKTRHWTDTVVRLQWKLWRRTAAEKSHQKQLFISCVVTAAPQSSC